MRGKGIGIMVAGVAVMLASVAGVQAWDSYDSHAWTGNVNVFIGAKALDKDDWEPAHEHGQIGLLLDFRQRYWPVNIAADLLFSYGDGTAWEPGLGNVDLEVTTAELNLGVRKIWDHFPTVRPYIGGGLAFIFAEGKATWAGLEIKEDDTAAGFWINGGVYWTLGGSFNIGIDLRYSSAEVTVADVDLEAGGGHAGLLLGFHW